MKKSAFNAIIALSAAMMLVLTPGAASAGVAASATADKTAVKAGDTVEVTLTVTGKNMTAAEGVFTYDPALLTFAEGAGGASDGLISMVSMEKNGSSTLAARIKFTAAKAGAASVDFKLERVLGYDGKDQGGADAGVSIAVEAPAAPPEPSPTPINYAAEGVAARGLEPDAPMYIWRNLENVTIPSKYSETTLDYHGETVAAVTVPDSDAPALLYLSDASGETGGYYIYDAGRDALYPYRTVNSVSKSYIMLRPDGAAVPEGFAETEITIDKKSVPAWVSHDAQGDVYLLYGRNPAGETGFYFYNPMDESIQRYAVLPARPVQPELPGEDSRSVPEEPHEAPAGAEAPEAAPARDGVAPALFYAVCAAAAALLIAFAAQLAIRSREKALRKRRLEMRRARRRQEQAEGHPEA